MGMQRQIRRTARSLGHTLTPFKGEDVGRARSYGADCTRGCGLRVTILVAGTEHKASTAEHPIEKCAPQEHA